MEAAEPALRVWATRSAGIIGMFLAILYLAVIVGQDDGLRFEPLVWFSVMALGGLLAWFADRASFRTGRRMVLVAILIFLVIGVLAVFTIGIGYLAAAVLCVLGIAGQRPSRQQA